MKLKEIKNTIDRYNYEKELYVSVCKGNIEKAREIVDEFKSFITSNLDKYNNKNSITRLKYICITAISIYSRMSIERGKSVSESYELADKLFESIEYSRDLSDIIDVCYKATMEFAYFNYERTDLYSLPIRKAIDYINNNIHKKIRVSDLSNVSKLSNDYLSLKFKEEVGININDFIMSKKLDKAKEQIMFNKYDRDIYKQYAFSTQSYFIQCFKKKFGKTPKDYSLNSIEKTMI